MAKAIPRGPLLRVEGIEPFDDPAWAFAGPRGQRAFYTEVMGFALKVKDKSLDKGLDIYGQKMQISEATRRNRRSAMGPAYYRAAPLSPSFEASRTRSYLRAEVREENGQLGVTFWWRYDPRTKDSWGKILEYQAQAGRNVIGWSEADLDKIFAYGRKWWAAHRIRLAKIGDPTKAVSFQSGIGLSLPSVRVKPARVVPPAILIDLRTVTDPEIAARILAGRHVNVNDGRGSGRKQRRSFLTR